MTPGELRERVSFQDRAADENGDKLGAWRNGFAVRAKVRPIKGGEGVLQSRLQGVQPYELTVRYSAQTGALTSASRAVWHARAGDRILNIRGATPSDDGHWVAIVCDEDASNA